jgi:hypothetical protein
MLFMPNWSFGFVHHFISADDLVFTKAKEIAEKLTLLVFQGNDGFF